MTEDRGPRQRQRQRRRQRQRGAHGMSIDETTFPCSSATPARTSTLSGTRLSDHSRSRVRRLGGAERTAVARVGRHARCLPRSQVHDELPLAIMLHPMQRHANSDVVHEPRRDLVVVQRRRWRPLPSVRELRRGAGPERDVGRALAVVVGGRARLEPLRVPYPVRKRIERGSASAHVSHAVRGWSSPKVRRPLGAFEHRTAAVCTCPALQLSRTQANTQNMEMPSIVLSIRT